MHHHNMKRMINTKKGFVCFGWLILSRSGDKPEPTKAQTSEWLEENSGPEHRHLLCSIRLPMLLFCIARLILLQYLRHRARAVRWSGLDPRLLHLHVLAHHGNHEIELAVIRQHIFILPSRRTSGNRTYKTDGFDESETQNGVREELATERGVTGNSLEKSSEDETDTDTGCDIMSDGHSTRTFSCDDLDQLTTTETNGGRTHTQVLRDLDKGVGHLRRVGTNTKRCGLGASHLSNAGAALHGVESGLARSSYDKACVSCVIYHSRFFYHHWRWIR